MSDVDAFVTKLNAAGSALIYSTYLGGSGSDTGSGIVLDADNNAYVGGATDSTNFPVTEGAFQGGNRGSFDAFIAKISEPPMGPDLGITKMDSPDPVVVGSDLTYTLVATNTSTGVDVAIGLFLTDELPAEVVFVSSVSTQGTCSETDNTVTCDLGDLAPEASATVEIVVTPLAEGEITNTAIVTSDVFDPNPDNNSATEVTTVVPVCTLELTPSYDSGTLTVEILVGTFTPATANLWATSQSNVFPIIAGRPITMIDPPTTKSISRPVPAQGVVGLLATLTTPEDGIICSDFQTVDTGSAP